MDILLWIVLGGIAGWLASIFMGRNYQQGVFTDILLGIIGAIVGGFVFSIFGGQGVTGFNIYSLFIAFVGAVLVIWVGRRMYGFR